MQTVFPFRSGLRDSCTESMKVVPGYPSRGIKKVFFGSLEPVAETSLALPHSCLFPPGGDPRLVVVGGPTCFPFGSQPYSRGAGFLGKGASRCGGMSHTGAPHPFVRPVPVLPFVRPATPRPNPSHPSAPCSTSTPVPAPRSRGVTPSPSALRIQDVSLSPAYFPWGSLRRAEVRSPRRAVPQHSGRSPHGPTVLLLPFILAAPRLAPLPRGGSVPQDPSSCSGPSVPALVCVGMEHDVGRGGESTAELLRRRRRARREGAKD